MPARGIEWEAACTHVIRLLLLATPPNCQLLSLEGQHQYRTLIHQLCHDNLEAGERDEGQLQVSTNGGAGPANWE